MYISRTILITSNSSMRSTSHWSCGSALMATCSLTKACGCFEVWSSPSRLRHCARGSPDVSIVRMSPSLMTPSWNSESIISAALTLPTNVACIFLNLSFNNSFNSTSITDDFHVAQTQSHSANECLKCTVLPWKAWNRQADGRTNGRGVASLNAPYTFIGGKGSVITDDFLMVHIYLTVSREKNNALSFSSSKLTRMSTKLHTTKLQRSCTLHASLLGHRASQQFGILTNRAT